jgi:hypothetical protein
MDDTQRPALEAYSRGQMTAIELRRRLGDIGYGDVLRLLGEADLPLPQASVLGREETIARARAWMFPKHGR